MPERPRKGPSQQKTSSSGDRESIGYESGPGYGVNAPFLAHRGFEYLVYAEYVGTEVLRSLRQACRLGTLRPCLLICVLETAYSVLER